MSDALPRHAGAARRSILLIGGRVEAGSSFNVVPDRCVFTVDRRMNSEEDYEEVREALFAVFDDAWRNGVKLEVEVFQEGRPSGYAPGYSARPAPAATFARSRARHHSSKCVPACSRSGSTLSSACQLYAYGPGLLTISHGPKEFVDTNRIVECAMIYARVAATLLRARPDAPSPSR